MLWGIGCHRSATLSLAQDLGGVHEPQPRLEEMATYWHLAPEDDQARFHAEQVLRATLQDRLAANTPCIDPAQSYVIPLILEIDPEATFTWSIRNPMLVVSSLYLASSVWKSNDTSEGQGLIYPKEGWGKEDDRLDKAIYYWVETNKVIREYCHLKPQRGTRWRLYFPEDLTTHANCHATTPEKAYRHLTADEAQRIAEGCWGLWEEIS